MTTKIRVVIVEDESLLRESLSMLIGLDPNLQVLSSYPNGSVALEAICRLNPDVVLTDLDMPKMDGIELTQKLSQVLPAIKIVILTKFGDDTRLFAALKSGAIGYLLKDSGLDEITGAIYDAASGMARLSPAIVSRVVAEFNRMQKQADETRSLFAELTRREVEVLELLGKGHRNRAIAEELCLSEKTVKTHVGAVLRKLHLLDRTEAALLAQRHGLGSP